VGEVWSTAHVNTRVSNCWLRVRTKATELSTVYRIDSATVCEALYLYLTLPCVSTAHQYFTLQYACIFTVRRSALHGLWDRNSVRLSVCPSVCPSVTLVDCVHMVRPTIMIFSPYGSPIILVSGDITYIPKFEGGHPERGR